MTTYITCDVVNGRLRPQGESKDESHAEEIAKLHKQVLCELRVLADYRENKD